MFWVLAFVLSVFEIKSHYTAQAGLELSRKPRLALNSLPETFEQLGGRQV